MYVLIAFVMHRPSLIFIWTFGVIFLTFRARDWNNNVDFFRFQLIIQQ